MKTKLKKFEEFVSSLFPSEVTYVIDNNQYQDQELFDILEVAKEKVSYKGREMEFDADIDLRKYSKLINNIEAKLQKIDVDHYYQWISQTDYQITTDAIPAEEQTRLLKEIEAFQPSDFHAGAFYKMIQHFAAYLLMRMRYKDYETVRSFLDDHQATYQHHLDTEEEISRITGKIVSDYRNQASTVTQKELDWLLAQFRNEKASKKNRYWALLAFNMYHVNTRQIDRIVEPMQQLEAAIFRGEFYSRRMLTNFYANKLMVMNHLGQYEEAAYCGLQSIKHYTEDYLYYLNNYCSILIHVEAYNEALEHMKNAFKLYKNTRDKHDQVIFLSNYCRCLNARKDYKTTIRLLQNFLDENKDQLFNYRWSYFFRTFFYALIANGHFTKLLRLHKKHQISEREAALSGPPYLAVMALSARYHELRCSEQEFEKEMAELRVHPDAAKKSDFITLCDKMQGMF